MPPQQPEHPTDAEQPISLVIQDETANVSTEATPEVQTGEAKGGNDTVNSSLENAQQDAGQSNGSRSHALNSTVVDATHIRSLNKESGISGQESSKNDLEQSLQNLRLASNTDGVSDGDAGSAAELDRSPAIADEKDNEMMSSRKAKGKIAETKEDWDEKVDYQESNATPAMPSADAEFEPKPTDPAESEAKPEIDSIMQQFKDGEEPSAAQTSSPSRSSLPAFQRPPRISSLQSLPHPESSQASEAATATDSHTANAQGSITSPTISKAPSLVSQPPLPEPDPEPDLPFDFHRFLEQLRHRTADPVARFLRSFLHEFGKRQWMVHEQVKIINDFLAFIGNRMAQCEVWRQVSDAEFENAKEGMEKLVMNRLYSQTFSPEIPAPEQSRSRRKGPSNVQGPGRRGQHQEDVERDEVLAQKVRIYGWLREEHLDVKPLNEKGRKFLRLAQQELLKIRSYRAPRDKVICVLNCCKVLFGYLRNSNTDQSADAFIPLLIFTVLKANPDHLVSNVQYILRFRNQDRLSGESGYYMSSLLGAVQFIENLDRTQLTVTDEEFEKNVEEAVSNIAERRSIEEKRAASKASPGIPISEKSTPSRPEVTPRSSLDAVSSMPQRSNSRGAAAASTLGAGPVATEDPPSEDNDAVAGLLRTIQKPLSTIGRIFSDDGPASTPPAGSTPRASPRPAGRTIQAPPSLPSRAPSNFAPSKAGETQRQQFAAGEAAARQASAESAEAHRRHTEEHRTVVETLQGMFPDLDKDVISDVVRMKQGRVGLAVDACLALSH